MREKLTMASYLCLSVTFLDATFHGRGEGDHPEWPPSPLRLFQALVAAAAARWRDTPTADRADQALRWLESQAAPTIVASSAHVGVPVRVAVPNNDMDVIAAAWAKRREPKKQPSELKTMKSVRTTWVRDGDCVHYLWPLSDTAREQVTGLVQTCQAIARSMVALGWGIDLVAGHGRIISEQEAQRLHGERWVPSAGPSPERLRDPVAGTLSALQARHRDFLARLNGDGFRPVPPLMAFQYVRYRRQSEPAARPYAAFKLLEPLTGKLRSYAATNSVRVSGMMRHSVAEAARPTGRSREWINQYVLGHRPREVETMPRFSYLPLPSIDHREVVSGIRRVMVAEPMNGSGESATWLRRLLPGQSLRTDDDTKVVALLAPLENHDWVLGRYVAPSASWATVTPVVLPGSDDGKGKKRERLFLKALNHAGYSPDALADVEFRRVPFFRGASDSLSYQPRPPHYLAGCSVYHVLIRWRQCVAGPIALGSGRHCGLGVFVSWTA
jgi:CRISPR-associated protein Csb2